MDKYGSKIMQQTKPKHLWGFALPSRILPTPREPIAWRNTFIDPVLPQSACVKCPSKLSKNCWTKSFFFNNRIISFSQQTLSLIFFFEGTRKFRITGRAGPFPNYVGEGSEFFISNSKKALKTRLFLYIFIFICQILDKKKNVRQWKETEFSTPFVVKSSVPPACCGTH